MCDTTRGFKARERTDSGGEKSVGKSLRFLPSMRATGSGATGPGTSFGAVAADTRRTPRTPDRPARLDFRAQERVVAGARNDRTPFSPKTPYSRRTPTSPSIPVWSEHRDKRRRIESAAKDERDTVNANQPVMAGTKGDRSTVGSRAVDSRRTPLSPQRPARLEHCEEKRVQAAARNENSVVAPKAADAPFNKIVFRRPEDCSNTDKTNIDDARGRERTQNDRDTASNKPSSLFKTDFQITRQEERLPQPAHPSEELAESQLLRDIDLEPKRTLTVKKRSGKRRTEPFSVRLAQPTYVEEHLDEESSLAEQYPVFGLKRLAPGKSGSHGDSFITRLSGPDGQDGPLVHMKVVTRRRMNKGQCDDLATYGRLAEARTLVVDEEIAEFRMFVVDLEAFHDDPLVEHVEFIFKLYKCSLLRVFSNPKEYNAAERLQEWSAQLLAGTAYLHGLGVIHRDLKPDNILLNWMLNLAITDFDLCFVSSAAKQLDYTQNYCSRYCGTDIFMAPEVIGAMKGVRDVAPGIIERDGSFFDGVECLYGPKVDFYCLGLVMYEIARAAFNSKANFTGDERKNNLDELRMARDSYRPTFNRFLRAENIRDRELQRLLFEMLDPVPETRPDYTAIKNHKWFIIDFHGESSILDLIPQISLLRRESPISSKHEIDFLADVEQRYTARAYLNSREARLGRRRTWINVQSELFDFMKGVEYEHEEEEEEEDEEEEEEEEEEEDDDDDGDFANLYYEDGRDVDFPDLWKGVEDGEEDGDFTDLEEDWKGDWSKPEYD